MKPLRPESAPLRGARPTVCPHCWMVNAGPFELCGRCGARMDTHLQESGGLRRTAPVQSPVPVGQALTPLQRLLVVTFVALIALMHLLVAFPLEGSSRPVTPSPVGAAP